MVHTMQNGILKPDVGAGTVCGMTSASAKNPALVKKRKISKDLRNLHLQYTSPPWLFPPCLVFVCMFFLLFRSNYKMAINHKPTTGAVYLPTLSDKKKRNAPKKNLTTKNTTRHQDHLNVDLN